MKKFAALLLALVMLVTLCACGSKDNGKTDDNKTVKVGLILGTGGLGDKNFNDMAYAGMQAAQTELGITFDYLEPETVSDYVPNLRTMCEAGDYDLIVCLGSDMSDALTEVAADFPNQKFSHVDSSLKLDNVSVGRPHYVRQRTADVSGRQGGGRYPCRFPAPGIRAGRHRGLSGLYDAGGTDRSGRDRQSHSADDDASRRLERR